MNLLPLTYTGSPIPHIKLFASGLEIDCTFHCPEYPFICFFFYTLVIRLSNYWVSHLRPSSCFQKYPFFSCNSREFRLRFCLGNLELNSLLFHLQAGFPEMVELIIKETGVRCSLVQFRWMVEIIPLEIEIKDLSVRSTYLRNSGGNHDRHK